MIFSRWKYFIDYLVILTVCRNIEKYPMRMFYCIVAINKQNTTISMNQKLLMLWILSAVFAYVIIKTVHCL